MEHDIRYEPINYFIEDIKQRRERKLKKLARIQLQLQAIMRVGKEIEENIAAQAVH